MLPTVTEILRGSLVERYVTCGNPACKCARGERHGPIWYLTVTLGRGHTTGGIIPEEKVRSITNRAVGCQIVSSPAKPFLAIEWLQPGEGEDTAALRLLGKLPDLYGSRFFDILLLDALYAQAPVLKLAAASGWDLVISLKQNQRDLYQSAMRLFARRPADCSGTQQHDGRTTILRRSSAARTGCAIRGKAFAKSLPARQARSRNH